MNLKLKIYLKIRYSETDTDAGILLQSRTTDTIQDKKIERYIDRFHFTSKNINDEDFMRTLKLLHITYVAKQKGIRKVKFTFHNFTYHCLEYSVVAFAIG